MILNILSLFFLNLSIYAANQAQASDILKEKSKNLDFSINIYFPENDEFSSKRVNQIFTHATKCINKALTPFQEKLQINLKLNSIERVPEAQLKRLGRDHFDFDLDEKGNIVTTYQNTFDTMDINITFGPFYGNHPMFLPTKELIKLVNSDEFKNTKEERKHLRTTIDLESYEDKEAYKKAHNIEELQDKSVQEIRSVWMRLKDQAIYNSIYPMSNELRLEQDPLSKDVDQDSINEAGITLAHEIMHIIGDLNDDYVRPETKGIPNLMGSYHGGNECVLNLGQVHQILKMRK